MRAFSGSRKGCAGVPATMGLSSSGDASDKSRHSSAQSARFERATAAQHGAEECARIGAPFAGGPVMRIGNEAARQLLDVVGVANLRERIPFEGARLERIQARRRRGSDRRIAPDSRRRDRRIRRGRRARAPSAKSSPIAVDFPVPVVPRILKCLVSSRRRTGTPANVSCSALRSPRAAATAPPARRAAAHSRMRTPRLCTSAGRAAQHTHEDDDAEHEGGRDGHGGLGILIEERDRANPWLNSP